MMLRSRRDRVLHAVALAVIAVVLAAYMVPIYWIVTTSFKAHQDIFRDPPVLVFEPTLSNYRDLFVTRAVSPDGTVTTRAAEYPLRLLNSIIIAFASTFAAIALGTMTAYAFSRFRTRGEGDLMFFILSTRMLPAVVIVIPIFLMYKALGWRDTHFGLILLYTTFNVSFAVWLLKGFLDEIPKEYEEAALVDGYSRLQAFRKVVLPQALAGIAATSVFCLITAWNEFTFALILTTRYARTAPPSIASVLGSTGTQWGQIAAGTVIFLLPVAVFTFVMRGQLLRGATFGALKR